MSMKILLQLKIVSAEFFYDYYIKQQIIVTRGSSLPALQIPALTDCPQYPALRLVERPT